MAIRIDGKRLAEIVRKEVAQEVEALTARGIVPHLAVLLVGDDPASEVYVRQKAKAAQEVGIRSTVRHLPAEASEDEVLAEVAALADDEDVDGILVQLPLPRHISEARVLEAIPPEKDVDGFTPVNMGRMLTGVGEYFVPCTPQGVLRILRETGVPLRGKRAAVIGRSNIVGKPTALLLLAEDMTVTVLHSRSERPEEVTREADVLVVAVGRPHLVTRSYVKPGAVVVDVGINRLEDGRLVGDVHPEVEEIAGWITPVPGGVGPMTVAMLLANTHLAAVRRRA
ncbi:bifunctional methylenetetrahydrofolate dehydrogenase/methenyltetrahydrofolate cyclohydrolase FolD [Brockia lithotrophica]|uniref:Bifunctional protein FolD n=1 Tax=Brockia lithotrophica TaxID=933949 RepID=A0A660L684_9BACL|nr:bifunctional methylenetetrahydrofolate dehydrogenase/methenyltetrahydrofolate cyclohydrolase FolD [Brockia lithotrophica]RKQ88734.1 methylenetetrahydrofolate dehydrogenase (NADP+)/methenyltetrahydrofolate cyclohydrolase [Brockia lithotrophica]